ncbi:MAG: M1 family metallopeptidase [Desulfosoma sp.]
MPERRFRYQREDFLAFPVTIEHMDMLIRFFEDRVEASNTLYLRALQPLEELALDARDLEMRSVRWRFPETPGIEAFPVPYRLDAINHKLLIRPPRPLVIGERFIVVTNSVCYPSDHLLEGIYRDVTPPGAPQQYMSQCQQWGFQRIMPVIDDCRAKCTMTTTLEGDARYTHMISNGNISRRHNPDGVPVPVPGCPDRKRITYHNPVPIAPYLFIACAGTWDALVDFVTYPNGRTVRLEYLVPPGRMQDARIPMDILKDAILWIYNHQGYEYPGETYRTICMTKSNYGGMENVGNTTIVTDAALVTEHSLDSHLLYAHAVIVHEFEHNQCGSETTMETPFDMWLNEAYTVDVERRYMADRFDPTYVRLQQVDSLRHPLLGPLAIEDGGHAGAIVRRGFNDPDELVDSVTYVKAAEVVRMLRLMLGSEAFDAGTRLYFSRYKNANANTDQFFQCLEEASGLSLKTFKKKWLEQPGYARVTAHTHHDPATQSFTVTLRQDLRDDQEPYPIPVAMALVNAQGQDMEGTSKILFLTRREQSFTLTGLTETPAFASLNRDASFYGTFQDTSADPQLLQRQALQDPNAFNRVEAFRQLTDLERVRLMTHPTSTVSDTWLNVFGKLLQNAALPWALKAAMLRIDEQPLDRRYAAWFSELVRAREALMKAVSSRFHEDLVCTFQEVQSILNPQDPLPVGIQKRELFGVLVDLLAVADTPAVHDMLLDHLRQAHTASERFRILTAIHRSSYEGRLQLLEETYLQWHRDVTGYANYLKIVGQGIHDDLWDLVEREKNRPGFDLTHPTLSRALLVTVATNTKKVWTEEGIDWIRRHVIEMAPINANIARRLLNTFQHVPGLQPPWRLRVCAALEDILIHVPYQENPSIAGQAQSYLEKCSNRTEASSS